MMFFFLPSFDMWTGKPPNYVSLRPLLILLKHGLFLINRANVKVALSINIELLLNRRRNRFRTHVIYETGLWRNKNMAASLPIFTGVWRKIIARDASNFLGQDNFSYFFANINTNNHLDRKTASGWCKKGNKICQNDLARIANDV